MLHPPYYGRKLMIIINIVEKEGLVGYWEVSVEENGNLVLVE
jgi:hypothetical protein